MIKIYTDGACKGNPGPGGWGVVIVNGEKIKQLSGSSKHTTNNIMELTATIEALSIFTKKTDIEIFTDSKYVKDGITSWIKTWLQNGWKTANKKPVKNLILWKNLYNLTQKHNLIWQWIKGHADNEYNNLADYLAINAIKKK